MCASEGVGRDFQYRKTTDSVALEIKRTGTGECWVEFSPAFSLRTEVVSVEMNGHPLPFKMLPNNNDQHLSVRFPVSGGVNSLVIRLKNDFGLALSNELPPLGSASRGLRVLSESWDTARIGLTLAVSGRAGERYSLEVWNPNQISSVDGGVLTKFGKLEIQMPEGAADSYLPQKSCCILAALRKFQRTRRIERKKDYTQANSFEHIGTATGGWHEASISGCNFDMLSKEFSLCHVSPPAC